MIIVLDASAMIAFLRNESGADIVEGLLTSDVDGCIAHAINLCEVYYDFLRSSDEATAKSAIADPENLGLLVREDLDRAFWQEVGRYEATNKVSLADCVAIALANRVGGDVATSDHHEFNAIATGRVCRVRFIR